MRSLDCLRFALRPRSDASIRMRKQFQQVANHALGVSQNVDNAHLWIILSGTTLFRSARVHDEQVAKVDKQFFETGLP
jgi:hypothetical protein